MMGIEMLEHGKRYQRSQQFIKILNGLWTEPPGTFNFESEHYTVRGGYVMPQPSATPHPLIVNVGIGRLCFAVADIDSVAKHLAAQGVEFVGPVSPYEVAAGVRPSGVEARFLGVRDPDGTVIEYAQFAQNALDVLKT